MYPSWYSNSQWPWTILTRSCDETQKDWKMAARATGITILEKYSFGGAFPKSLCMSKQLCFDEFPESKVNDKEWQCLCLWATAPTDPLCKPWHDCVEGKKSKEAQTLAEIAKAVNHLQGGQDALSQSVEACRDELSAENCERKKKQGKCSKAWTATRCKKTCGKCSEAGEKVEEVEGADCQNPSTMDIMAMECECGASFRQECENGDDPQGCWQNVLCTHSNICKSWQEKYCPPALLASDQMEKVSAARANSRVYVSNTSQQGFSSLEESLSGKRSC